MSVDLADADLDASFDERLHRGDMAIGGCFMKGRPAIMGCEVDIGSLCDEQFQDTSSPCTRMQ